MYFYIVVGDFGWRLVSGDMSGMGDMYQNSNDAILFGTTSHFFEQNFGSPV